MRRLSATQQCDVLFSIGTSSLVYPAAEIPFIAARAGATVVQVNPNATLLDDVAHWKPMSSNITPGVALSEKAERMRQPQA